jgi:hypothetical protein
MAAAWSGFSFCACHHPFLSYMRYICRTCPIYGFTYSLYVNHSQNFHLKLDRLCLILQKTP